MALILRNFFTLEELNKNEVGRKTGFPISLRPSQKKSLEDKDKFISGVEVDIWSEIWLVDVHGEKIARVGLIESEEVKTWAWMPLRQRTTFRPTETVLMATIRAWKISAKKVRYIIDKGAKIVWHVPEKELRKFMRIN